MTTIEWTHVPDGKGGRKKGETINPQVGCREISPGCKHCYAAKQAHLHAKSIKQHAGLTVVRSNGVHWNGEIRRVPEQLEKVLRWRDHRGIFWGSMTDLFIEANETDEGLRFIDACLGTMAAGRPEHTHMLLTKRPDAWVAHDGKHGECWIVDSDGNWSNWTGDPPFSPDRPHADAVIMSRVSKHAGGRELDGRTWDEFPEVAR